jgi:hypothetical protein
LSENVVLGLTLHPLIGWDGRLIRQKAGATSNVGDSIGSIRIPYWVERFLLAYLLAFFGIFAKIGQCGLTW